MTHRTVLLAALLAASPASAEMPTSVNQVFQFSHSGTCNTWSDGSKNDSTAYLWIPEECRKLRGVLILCANVPEHRLVGHPAIRKVCAAHDLGIVWNTPTFMNFAPQKPGQKKMAEEWSTTVGFLQQQLDALAKISGYSEVATVPWLPMGESGHLLMVDALVEAKPERCLAGIWIKNSHLPPKNRRTPALVVLGTAQEWDQDKFDIRTKWNAVDRTYAGILNERKKNPDWPLSYVIDGQSGHFDCSDRLAEYFAHYIGEVAKARLSDDGGPALKAVEIAKGFLADLPVPGHEGQPVKPAAANRTLPWYFDEWTVREAQAIARINWKAETQLPAFRDDAGRPLPFNFRGITDLKLPAMEADGITFTLRGTLLDRIPAGFVGAGEKLAQGPAAPEVEWLCGPLEPLGGGRFRIVLGRGGGPAYVALRQPGTEAVRGIVEPARIEVMQMANRVGKPQKITLQPIPDVPGGSGAVPLIARSDSGLPVSFSVVSGPAIIEGGKLVLTKIPPRSPLPIAITVAAWQWGRSAEPKVQTAETVKRTFAVVGTGGK